MELSETESTVKAFENFNIDQKIQEIGRLPGGRNEVFFYVDKYYGKIQCRIIVDSRKHPGIKTFILKCDSILGAIGCVEIPYSSSSRYFNYYQEIKIIPEFEDKLITVKLSIMFADNTGYSSSWEV